MSLRQGMSAFLCKKMARLYLRRMFQDSEKRVSLTVNGHDSRTAAVSEIALQIEYSLFLDSK
jgi:hypothetical protein